MNATSRSPRVLLALAAAGAASLAGMPPLAAQAEDESLQSYSYVRSLEGRATLASWGNGPGEEAELNQILQQGDRIRVERSEIGRAHV